MGYVAGPAGHPVAADFSGGHLKEKTHHAPKCLSRPKGLPQKHHDAEHEATDDAQSQVVHAHDCHRNENQHGEDSQPQWIHHMLQRPRQADLHMHYDI